MPQTKRRETWVKVKDYEGNDFICPLPARKNPAEATGEELGNCVDSATVASHAGNITIAGSALRSLRAATNGSGARRPALVAHARGDRPFRSPRRPLPAWRCQGSPEHLRSRPGPFPVPSRSVPPPAAMPG